MTIWRWPWGTNTAWVVKEIEVETPYQAGIRNPHILEKGQMAVKCLGRVLLLVCAVLGADIAHANPFFFGRFHGLKSGPLDQAATATYWNPANLAGDKTKVHLHLLLIGRRATYDRFAEENNVAPEFEAVNAGLSKADRPGKVPALALSWGTHLDSKWSMGVGSGFFVDRAGVSNWLSAKDAPAQYPGAVDGTQRWSGISTAMLMISPTAGLGVAYRPWKLKLGASLIYNRAVLSTTMARNVDSTDQVVDARGNLSEGRILLEHAKDEALGAVFGLGWEPTDDLSFGIAWHTGVEYNLKGTVYATFGSADEVIEPAAIGLAVPHTVRTSLGWSMNENRRLRTEITWADWSTLETQKGINLRNDEVFFEIARNFIDTWRTRVVFEHDVGRAWTLLVAGAYETKVVEPQNFEPGLSENDLWEVGGGFDYAFDDKVKLSFSYSWQQMFDLEVREGSRQKPPQNGRYTMNQDFMTLDLEFLL